MVVTACSTATASSMLSFAHTRSASPKSRFSTRLFASSIVSEPLSADNAAKPSAENWPSRAKRRVELLGHQRHRSGLHRRLVVEKVHPARVLLADPP